ncbi:universal stress protein [Streptomyces lavendulae]|uniref:universal stress protein n=1 Tax=Streptomyces lavendulae TaxID=1914 RepID=UPI0033F4FAE0
MNRRIVAGLDGSTESVAAARWAAREAELRAVPLHLVHAEEWETSAGFPVTGADVRHQWAQNLLLETSESLRGEHPGLDISTEWLDGLPTASLIGVAAVSDMLVLGSRGLGSIAGSVLGSVGMAAVRTTERPVVLVRASEDGTARSGSGHPARDMLMGVDISRPCDRLLAFAFEEASRRACTLRVMHSWSAPPVLGYAPPLYPGIGREANRGIAAALHDLLAPWQHKFPSVHLVERVTAGHPAQELLGAEDGAGIVIVGRRIRRSVFGAHIGPVAHALIHHALAPVAVIAHD